MLWLKALTHSLWIQPLLSHTYHLPPCLWPRPADTPWAIPQHQTYLQECQHCKQDICSINLMTLCSKSNSITSNIPLLTSSATSLAACSAEETWYHTDTSHKAEKARPNNPYSNKQNLLSEKSVIIKTIPTFYATLSNTDQEQRVIWREVPQGGASCYVRTYHKQLEYVCLQPLHWSTAPTLCTYRWHAVLTAV